MPYFWLPRSELPERSRKSCSLPNSRSEKRTRRVGLSYQGMVFRPMFNLHSLGIPATIENWSVAVGDWAFQELPPSLLEKPRINLHQNEFDDYTREKNGYTRENSERG